MPSGPLQKYPGNKNGVSAPSAAEERRSEMLGF